MPKPLFVPGYACITNKPIILNMPDKQVVIVEVNRIAMNECHMDILALVFTINHKPPFKLHLQKSFAVDMAGNEISTLPVIRQTQAIETIVGQTGSNFVKVVVLFLSRIQCLIWYAVKQERPHHQSL